MRVAALQSDIAWEDPETNFTRLDRWIRTAVAAGVRFLALPEMFACGFSMRTDRISEPIDGPSTRFLREQARTHRMWLAGSIPELQPGMDKPHNTLIVAGPNHEIHRYHKIHPFTYAGEHEHFRPGDSWTTIEIEGLRLTFFICYDLRFADEFWATAEKTDAYVVVANWPETRRHHWQTLLAARAIENQAYVIAANRVGEGGGLRYTGDSRILDPVGAVLAAAAEQETLLIADVDAECVRKARQEFPFMRDRR